jgi:hypothetical protein
MRSATQTPPSQSLERRVVNSRSVWFLRGWSRSFERKRFLTHVFVSTPLALCAAQINFVCWVIVFFVGFWAFPYRVRWTGETLEVSWLFVRESLHLRDIESARLREDFRHLLLFRPRLVLDIALCGGRHAIIVAPQRLLETFHSELTAELGATSVNH